MQRLILWRHGRTPWNAEHRFQGQTDVPLDAVGLAQAERAAELLATMNPHAIVASDLSRAAVTAEALARRTGLAVEVDPDLRETFAGEWQGLTRAEIVDRYGDALVQWAAGADVRPGGGETRLEVAARTVGALERALTRVPDDGVLVAVTHGGAARAAIGALLGLPPEHWAALGVLTNCAWSVLWENSRDSAGPGPRWRLQEYNAGTLPEPVPSDGQWPADDR